MPWGIEGNTSGPAGMHGQGAHLLGAHWDPRVEELQVVICEMRVTGGDRYVKWMQGTLQWVPCILWYPMQGTIGYNKGVMR